VLQSPSKSSDRTLSSPYPSTKEGR